MSSIPSLRVMLVDDSNTIRNVGSSVLTEAGCVVMCCTDGFNCITQAIDFQPDLFLIDVVMPRLDGYQTVKLIRNKDTFKQTPIIMLSSKDGMFDIARGKAAGATNYITKPFSKDDIRKALKECFPNRSLS